MSSTSLDLEEQRQKLQEFGKNVSAKVQDMTTRARDQMQTQSEKTKESIDNVRAQLLMYGNQIRDYLDSIDADIEDYRFLVEKKENETLVDVSFKATIKQRS